MTMIVITELVIHSEETAIVIKDIILTLTVLVVSLMISPIKV